MCVADVSVPPPHIISTGGDWAEECVGKRKDGEREGDKKDGTKMR